MTKMKSKKMTKSTFAIIIMAVVMVAMIAFGGTYAYFTATATDATGSAKTGTIALNMGQVATITTGFKVSGQEILDSGKVTVSLNEATNVSTWIFVTFEASFDAREGATVTEANNKSNSVTEGMAASAIEALFKADGDYALVYEVNTDGGWLTLNNNVYAYLVEYNATGTTEANIPTVCDSIKFYGRTESSTTTEDQTQTVEVGALMDGSIVVTVSTDAIQAEGFTGTTATEKAQAAYDALVTQRANV